MLELRWECEPIGPEDGVLVPAGPIYLSGVVSLDEQATTLATTTLATTLTLATTTLAGHNRSLTLA